VARNLGKLYSEHGTGWDARKELMMKHKASQPYMLDVALVFSDTPGGRYRNEGKHSGEEFREDHLIPALESNDRVVVDLDGVKGLMSSFLEEVFGGVVRRLGPDAKERVVPIAVRRPSRAAKAIRYQCEARIRLGNLGRVMATYVSDRGLPLVLHGIAGVSTLTVENYLKWYCLYLVHSDGSVEPVQFPRESPDPHVPYPAAVEALAEENGWEICAESMEMIIGRYLCDLCDFDASMFDGNERFVRGRTA
jgi:hypothetical protein